MLIKLKMYYKHKHIIWFLFVGATSRTKQFLKHNEKNLKYISIINIFVTGFWSK